MFWLIFSRIKYQSLLLPPMYKIPKDGDVILAIRNVLARYSVVDYQRKL